MNLELEDGTLTQNPTDSQIEQALASLAEGQNSFAILGPSDMTYIQAAVVEGGLILEYQAGGLDRHYQAATVLALAEVVRAFQDYAQGGIGWKSVATWQSMAI